MPTSIKDLPGEVFDIILSDIAPIDYLKVKLVSKDFCKWADTVFKWEEMTKIEVIRGQTSLEACLPRGRRLKILTCTHCGLVKPSNLFSDNQAAKTNPKRICISCGISNKTYTKHLLPKINGESHIPCWHCRMAVPMSNNWEEILTSGKADLTRILQASRSEGQLLKYKTKDGRLLTWVAEPELLAFCIPCLELMKRLGQAGRITRR